MTGRVDLVAADPETLTARAVAVTADVLGTWVEDDVEVLKAVRHKSLVVRLVLRAGPRRTVIAKLCPTEVAERERRVYERVLPALPVSAPGIFGVSAEGDGLSWLVLEDAGDLAWSPGLGDHRTLAATWFGAAQLAAVDAVAEVPLPARGAGYYRDVLRSAQAVTAAAAPNPALAPDAVALLRRFAASCAALESEWALVETLLARFPTTLTLPGFCRKNARVRRTASAIELLPFDFENAGWGPPAADVQHVELPVYRALVAPAWGVGDDDLVALAAVGSALVSLKSVPGEHTTLLSPWPERAVRKIGHYTDALERALEALSVGGPWRR